MKAMVLAAGLGLRMRPLTRLLAKPALPVLNRPLLHWTLELLARHGVEDVVINLHHRPESVRQAVGDGRRFGLRVRYSLEPRILGTGGGPRKVRDFFGDEPCLLVNGDVAFDLDLTRLMARHLDSGARATLVLRPNPDPRRYGPVVTDGAGRIRWLPGLPGRAAGRVSLFTGVHILDPALLAQLPTGPSDSVRDLYAPLVASGERLRGVRLRGRWYDLGSPAAYLASQLAMLASGFDGIGPRRALVAAGAGVDPHARLRDAVIGPGAVVGYGATLTRCVLWEGARVGAGARIRDVIVTGGARVAPGETLRGCVIVPRGRVPLR